MTGEHSICWPLLLLLLAGIGWSSLLMFMCKWCAFESVRSQPVSVVVCAGIN